MQAWGFGRGKVTASGGTLSGDREHELPPGVQEQEHSLLVIVALCQACDPFQPVWALSKKDQCPVCFPSLLAPEAANSVKSILQVHSEKEMLRGGVTESMLATFQYSFIAECVFFHRLSAVCQVEC